MQKYQFQKHIIKNETNSKNTWLVDDSLQIHMQPISETINHTQMKFRLLQNSLEILNYLPVQGRYPGKFSSGNSDNVD